MSTHSLYYEQNTYSYTIFHELYVRFSILQPLNRTMLHRPVYIVRNGRASKKEVQRVNVRSYHLEFLTKQNVGSENVSNS